MNIVSHLRTSVHQRSAQAAQSAGVFANTYTQVEWVTEKLPNLVQPELMRNQGQAAPFLR